ncbi:collagen alpha-1(I) chain-like [Strigops habroptila]|nr:collagen alpha-1(I) chain-like [Strigops habroptila]
MSHQAKASGGGMHPGGSPATHQEKGAKGSTHSPGFSSSGISPGPQASHMTSHEASSHGGGAPRGGTTSTGQPAPMGDKGGRH